MISIKEYYGKNKKIKVFLVLSTAVLITTSCNNLNSKTAVNSIDTVTKSAIIRAK